MEFDDKEIFTLLKELTDIYTSKESTSISYETAQQLMEAIYYCINENELEYENKNAITTNNTKFHSLREAYDNGYRLVVDRTKKANEIYNDIILEFNAYRNRAYYDTVMKGIPEFFKWYDPRLNPMNHIILADYNVLENIYDYKGIDFIYQYLICIQKEQKFLKRFPEEFIYEVLIKYHPDYEELIINICGILLRRILANMLIGNKINKIELKPDDYKRLYKIINNLNIEDLKTKLHYLLNQLIVNHFDEDIELYNYLANDVTDISTEFKNAVQNNCILAIV